MVSDGRNILGILKSVQMAMGLALENAFRGKYLFLLLQNSNSKSPIKITVPSTQDLSYPNLYSLELQALTWRIQKKEQGNHLILIFPNLFPNGLPGRNLHPLFANLNFQKRLRLFSANIPIVVKLSSTYVTVQNYKQATQANLPFLEILFPSNFHI